MSSFKTRKHGKGGQVGTVFHAKGNGVKHLEPTMQKTVVTHEQKSAGWPRIVGFDLDGTIEGYGGHVKKEDLYKLKDMGKEVWIISQSLNIYPQRKKEFKDFKQCPYTGTSFRYKNCLKNLDMFVGDKPRDKEYAIKANAKYIDEKDFNVRKMVTG